MSYEPPSDQGWDRPPGTPPGWPPGPPGPPGPPAPPGPQGGWAPPPPPSGYGPGPYPPYPPPQYGGYPGGYRPPTRTDGTAIAALILSIASFVICPVIPAIVALVLIPGSRRTIRSSGGAVEGESLLTAAKIVSLIHLGLVAVVAVFLVIGIIVSASTSPSLLLPPLLG